MDVFFEQIVPRKPSSVELVLRVITVIIGIIAMVAMLVLAIINLTTLFAGFFVLFAFALGFGLYFSMNRLNVEYEYSLTNGSFDIDRIIGKRKRQRIISTECRDFEEFGAYGGEAARRLSQREFDAKVFAANLRDDGLCYAIVQHKDAGTVLIVIEPDERMTGALKKFVPKAVLGDDLCGD